MDRPSETVYSRRWEIFGRDDQEKKIVEIATATEKYCNLHYFSNAPRIRSWMFI